MRPVYTALPLVPVVLGRSGNHPASGPLSPLRSAFATGSASVSPLPYHRETDGW